ncbi:MAG: FMN-binding protein [Planctomycetia bacterium]|nr:FMN-binding protein [Planctomycetia bacterium]
MSETVEKQEETLDRHYLRQAWLVLFLSVLYAAILVFVDMSLSAKIADNKKQETYSQIPTLVPGAVSEKTVEHVVIGTDGKPARVLQAFDKEGVPVGWVFAGNGQGFADAVELIVGLDPKLEKLTGLYVLNQKETPGLGNYIVDEKFRSQFVGKSTLEPLLVTKAEPVGNEIKALTGATISSQSVCDIINATILKYRDAVSKL